MIGKALSPVLEEIERKLWELQEKEGMSIEDRWNMAEKVGLEIRKLVKTYTDIDTIELFK